MRNTIIPVILCGGSGTRLWPLSRQGFPKQFLDLRRDGKSMLIQSLQRLNGLDNLGAPLIVCNEEHRFIVGEQLRRANLSDAAMILEPAGRNTAPATTLAALEALQRSPGCHLLVLPSDHLIRDQSRFLRAIQTGTRALADHRLITFGITPNRPETGFGYIQAGEPIQDQGIFPIERFVEKPDRETAQRYLASGRYLWNSGMFLFRAEDWLSELEYLAPDILSSCREAWRGAERSPEFIRPDPHAFQSCRSESVDYAVMEKTERGSVVPLDAGWSDLGSWDAVWEDSERDPHQNCLAGDAIAIDTEGSYLFAGHRLVATVGVRDLVVVETADAVLVIPREQSQDVKKIVQLLNERQRPEANQHRKVYRPWGHYVSLHSGPGHQVKKISVNPGAGLSLQKHHHRAEHWVVIRGTALITLQDEQFELSENQSCHIPMGAKHRLENRSMEPLEIIEVQLGSYLGEDDIVRYQDDYGRLQR